MDTCAGCARSTASTRSCRVPTSPRWTWPPSRSARTRWLQELDARETQMMAEAGKESAEFLRFVAEGSNNVDADGNFSIQVLSKMLQVWGLQCIPIDGEDAGSATREPAEEAAFICNLQSHWFAIRRLDGEWYNLNSLFDAPEWLSPIYLSAFLGTLRMQGYSIFVVRGGLPPAMVPTADLASGYGRWLPRSVTRPTQQAPQRQPAGGAAGAGSAGRDRKPAPSAWSGKSRSLREPAGWAGADDGASAASNAVAGPGPSLVAGAALAGGKGPLLLDDDAELQAALDASLREFEARGAEGGGAAAMASDAPSMLSSAAMSNGADAAVVTLSEEPAVDAPGALTLMIQGDGLQGGVRRISRRFMPDDLLELVVNFARANGADMRKQALVVSYPRKVLQGVAYLTKTLAELGIPDKSLLLLQPVP